MPIQYEATFAIHPPAGAEPVAGTELIRQANELLMAATRPTTDDEPAPELETGAAGDIGYAIISGERRHSRHPERYVRLEARLCTTDGVAYAQIRTRYLSADPHAPNPETPAGPPRLLRALTERFACRQQITPISAQPCRLTTPDTETFSREHIANPGRTLPILIITDPPEGSAIINPTDAARVLAGLAQVVHTDQNGISPTPGVKRCNNGWAAFYWPPGPSGSPRIRYYAPNGRPPSALDLQRECLAQAPASDFDARFVTARSEVILHRNRLLEARQQTAPAPADATETDELRRQARKEQIRANYNSQRLRAAQDRIQELEAQLRELTDDTEPNTEAVPEPTPEPSASAFPTDAIPLSGTVSDNVTIVCHAINLYRESMRRYIIRTLRQRHNPGQIAQLLTGSVELDRHYTRQLAETDPHTFLDVTIFESVVDSCPQDFAKPGFSRQLAEIRRIRNLTAHPAPQGIPYDIARDGIRTICQTLKQAGDDQTAAGVSRLGPLIRPNQERHNP